MVGKDPDPHLMAVSGVISARESFKGLFSKQDCVVSEVRVIRTHNPNFS